MLGTHFSLNGRLLPVEEAKIPVDQVEFSYGFGVYETLRVRHGHVFFLTDHAERLMQSAVLIELDHPFTVGHIEQWINELVKKNNPEAANIKVLLIGGKQKQDAQLFAFLLAPKFLEKKEYREGVKVTTFHHERFLPQAKTLNMLPSYIAYTKAQRSNAFDALFIDRNGNITEGTRSNFFAIKEKTLFTPPLTEVLDGITRRNVIACAVQYGYEIEEQLIPLSKIFEYDGAFVTNTSGGIVPIRTIDDHSFPSRCEAVQELRKYFENQ